MLTRRSTLTGLTAFACGCGLPHTGLAQDGSARRSIGSLSHIKASTGCLVAEQDFRRDRLGDLGSGPHMSSFTVGQDRYVVASTTGDRLFDRAMAEALYHISTTFDVLPTFGFIQGSNVENAFATTKLFEPEPGDAPLPTREDGTVLFGDGILGLMRRKGVQDPVAAVLAICAHEFAHIVQYRYVYNDRPVIDVLIEGRPTVKRAELHADYLAGYYVATAAERNPNAPTAQVAQAAYVIGDYNTDSRGHHGTPQERGTAVQAGFKAYRQDRLPFTKALVAGLAHVGAI